MKVYSFKKKPWGGKTFQAGLWGKLAVQEKKKIFLCICIVPSTIGP